MTDILRIVAIGVTGALCALVLRRHLPDTALTIALITGAMLMALVLRGISSLREFLDELTALSGLSPAVLSPLLRTVGIALVCKTAAELCRDAGEGGIAAAVETAGAVSALCVALPLLRSVVTLVSSLL